MSPEDVQQLGRCVESMASRKLDIWDQFSVAFHVEQQQVGKEAVCCTDLSSLLLPLGVAAQDVQLLKGSYPAFAVLDSAPLVKWVNRSHRSFDSVKVFAEWVVVESRQRNLRLEFNSLSSERYRDALLKAAGLWPNAEVKGVKDMVNRRLNLEKMTSEAFQRFLIHLRVQHDEPLIATIHPRSRWGTVYTGVSQEKWRPVTDQLKVFKIPSDDGDLSTDFLGVHRLEPDAKVLKTFTIKNRCVVLITTSPSRTLVERVYFPAERSLWSENVGKVTCLRSFGKMVALCDFNVHDRLVAFVEEGGRVWLYRFDEVFTSLEIYQRVELSLRTSLVFPVTNVLLMDGALYATDSNGSIQSVNLTNQQTPRAVQLTSRELQHTNTLFAMAGNMVLGFTENASEAGSIAKFAAVSSEDFRGIPVNMNDDVALWSRSVCVQCFGDNLFVLDTEAKKIRVLRTIVTRCSDSFRIKHSVNNREYETDGFETHDVDHWLRAFYHTYDKFPVCGLIRGVDDSRVTLRVHVACSSALTKSVEQNCRTFFQAVMRDLRKLNKPLSGMDLARDLAFVSRTQHTLANVAVQSFRSLLQELITFVPIQICRAERNTLIVLTNGEETPVTPQSQDVRAVDIARSTRFGLLSLLLESWHGRCVVISAMGKQSTGKSYFLNHLTGSSFAIGGTRCDDGAWMAIRVLPKSVLLIVLYFEGLGSFKRTEQEDVFLSVLNASISMFTVFRVEMRLDKDIDELLERFQKGIALMKGEPALFKGKLYMSVKDVHTNDKSGVMDEFLAKFQKILDSNKDSNFLLDLYSGQLEINCSPPLGTTEYYKSLMHAQSFIETSLCGDGSTGFRSGKAFLNCIRLVLAKIAILDWTSLEKGTSQFQLLEISSKLPRLLRTGCIVPQKYVAKEGPIAAYLKEDIVATTNEKVIDLDVAAMSAQYPTMADKWRSLNESVILNELEDTENDFGFDICSTDDETMERVHQALKKLLSLFLRNNTSVGSGKISHEIVEDFDTFLAYVVRRRKARISLWVKQMLGGRVPEEWNAIEQEFLGRFQKLFTRCQSKCADCRLGCVKAAAHPRTARHDCGGSHVCAGYCEYCDGSKCIGKTPSCAKEAGTGSPATLEWISPGASAEGRGYDLPSIL